MNVTIPLWQFIIIVALAVVGPYYYRHKYIASMKAHLSDLFLKDRLDDWASRLEDVEEVLESWLSHKESK